MSSVNLNIHSTSLSAKQPTKDNRLVSLVKKICSFVWKIFTSIFHFITYPIQRFWNCVKPVKAQSNVNSVTVGKEPPKTFETRRFNEGVSLPSWWGRGQESYVRHDFVAETRPKAPTINSVARPKENPKINAAAERPVHGGDFVDAAPRVVKIEESVSSVPERSNLRGGLLIDEQGIAANAAEIREFDTYFSELVSGGVDFKHPDLKKRKNLALFIYPKVDHNRAFAINDHLKFRLLGVHAQVGSVRLEYVYGVAAAREKIEQAIREGYEIDHLVLGGHGDGKYIRLGWGDGDGLITKNNLDQLLKGVQKHFTKNATVFLDSCSSGTLLPNQEKNITTLVSETLPDTYVYGAYSPLSKFDLLYHSAQPVWLTIKAKMGVGGAPDSPLDGTFVAISPKKS